MADSTASTSGCVCCHPEYNEGAGGNASFVITTPTCQGFSIAGHVAQAFTTLGHACQPFSIAGHTCQGFTYSDGRQEGCECPTPITYITAYLAGTGTITFGGSAYLTATDTTKWLDSFLPPGLRVLLYVDGVTAKGSMIPLTAGNTATGEGTANFVYVGPAGSAGTSTFASIAAGRPWFGSNTADWTFTNSVTNTPKFNNARFELMGRFDPQFTAGHSGYSLVVVTLGQYTAFNDATHQLGAMWVMPSPFAVSTLDNAYMTLGQDFFNSSDTNLVATVREQGASFKGLNIPVAFLAGSNTSFLAPYGPSAFAYGCVVPTTASSDNQIFGQFDWYINQTAGGVLTPINVNTTDLLPHVTASIINYTAQPLLTFGATRSIGADTGFGAPNTSRYGVWLLVEGAMTTAQIVNFVTAALLGYRMKGANP